MIWLLLIALLVLIVTGWLWLRRPTLPMDRSTYRALISIYAIRKRMEVAQFKVELKRDAARVRREMNQELDRHRRRLP